MARQISRSTQFNRIVAKAWADKKFYAELMKDPAGTLRKEGVHVPKGQAVEILVDTKKIAHLVVPPKPRSVKPFKATDCMIC